MTQNAPQSQDIQDIQFKLHDRFKIFPKGKYVKSLVSLLAVSSSKGLIFAGNPNDSELKIFKVRDLVDSKTTGQNVKVRVINLPGEPKVLACSCCGSMLAVNYVLNNTGFLQIYQVESFVTPTPNLLYNLPIAPESNVYALQLLWNPVIANNLALILTDGSVTMFTLNNGAQYEKVTLGKEHQVKSGCWSPKGKQIVFGFAEGKLQQFKPNLQPARPIPCPAGIHPGPFDCISVHWLSTFQFAAIFLQRGKDMCPSLFIVNAPKAGQPSYINYYDICYSAPGPRIQQMSFSHIAQWNLLLLTSANGVEVGVLGTKETGETPRWVQYTLLDEGRIEMPLTESIDETYPLGFALDTSSVHQLAIGEKKLPVMPMVHVLSTYGELISYNFLNLSPNAVDICSPPPLLNDISGQFVSLSETLVRDVPGAVAQVKSPKSSATSSELDALNKAQNQEQGFSDTTFTLGPNMVTSTPASKDKPMNLFGSQSMISKSIPNSGFPKTTEVFTAPNTTPATARPPNGWFVTDATPNASAPNRTIFSQQFGGMSTGTQLGGFSAKPSEQTNAPATQQSITQSNTMNKNLELNKPLYTIPPTFIPPTVPQQQPVKTETKLLKPVVSTNKINLNTGEIDEVIKQMIVIQIEAFETELNQIRQHSKHIMGNIGSAEEMKSYTKQLNDLQEILEQANDHEFEQDVQSLRHSMNESYAMLAECRTKLDLYNTPNLTRLATISSTDPTNRRQLAKLHSYVASNQNQLCQLNQLIDAQWSQYQDVVRRNSKNQMHIPCLDGIYQRMSKLKDLLSKQRTKMNYIKTKLKQKGLNYKPVSGVDVTSAAVGALRKSHSTMESLADSILSMSLSQVVSQTHAKLSEEKLNAIRNFTKRQQQIAIVKPKRPDRVGLKSEVVLETKLETERKQKEMVQKQHHLQEQQQQYQQKQQNQQQYQQQQQQQQQIATYKAPINLHPGVTQKTQQQQNYQVQLQQQLLKPQANLSANQQQPILAKPTASKPSIVSSQPPIFITPTSSTAATLSFGGNSSFVKTSATTTSASKPEEISKPIVTSTSFTSFGITNFNQSKAASTANDNKENKTISTPISFSAKIIGGDNVKTFANLGNKTTTQTNMMQPPAQSFTAPSAGFSAFATTKLASQTSSQDKDAAKTTDEETKYLGFTATTSSSDSFASLAASTKSVTATATTPFAALSPSSLLSFNATVTASSTKDTVSVANNTSYAETTTTNSSQPSTVITTKPIEAKTPVPKATTATAISTPASSIASTIATSGSKTSDLCNVTKTSSDTSEAKPAAFTATSTATDVLQDSLLSSLNICKPTVKEAGSFNKSGNNMSVFAAATSAASTGPFTFATASAAADGTKTFLGSTTITTATTTSTGFSFVTAATGNKNVANIFEKPATTGSATTVPATETTTTTFPSPSIGSTLVSTSATDTTATKSATTSSFSIGTTAPATASTADSLFGSLSLSSSTVASTATTTITNTASVTTTPTAATGNIFGGGSSLFSQVTTTAITTTTTSVFGSGAAGASTAPSMFGSAASVATKAASPVSESIFAAAAAAATPQPAESIFGGIPKPDQSVFSATNTATQPAGTGLFAAAGTKAPVTGGSIFGGSSPGGFGASTGGSIFGGRSAAPSNAFGSTAGSMFAPAEGGGSIFSSPTQQSATSGGSLFGTNAFGSSAAAQQSAGSIFGVGNAQSPNAGGFGASGESIFRSSNSANTSASGGSLFGATPTFGASTTSPRFSSFSQPSTAPPFSGQASGFGASSPTGFGSPLQQSLFAKPVLGGSVGFSSPQPSFGTQSTFGGSATFSSPKTFGSFAASSATSSGFGAQESAAPKENIFETLGSQDSGLSFGNLAHSAQAPQQKPAFGGSSFMNYRS